MSKKLLVLLGNTNDIHGVLSETAILRAQLAIEMVKKDDEFMILATGTFGDNFNLTPTPHGKLLEKFLLENGVSKENIYPGVVSTNTIEDSYGVLRFLYEKKSIQNVHIITSAFHMERVKFIFGRVLQKYNLEFHEAPDPKNAEHLRKLDKKYLRILKKEWVDISTFHLSQFPTDSYRNLGNELRHYDYLSFISIAAAFLMSAFAMSHAGKLKILFACLFALFLWHLYQRFASTAASARRILYSIEKLYGVPGLSSTKNKMIFPLSAKSTIFLLIWIWIAFIILFCKP